MYLHLLKPQFILRLTRLNHFWNGILCVTAWTFIRQALEKPESFPFQGVFDIPSTFWV